MLSTEIALRYNSQTKSLIARDGTCWTVPPVRPRYRSSLGQLGCWVGIPLESLSSPLRASTLEGSTRRGDSRTWVDE